MFIACDEQLEGQFHIIGSTWIPNSLVGELEKKASNVRLSTGMWGEVKWNKLSGSYLPFYKHYIDCFFDEPKAYFNCIIYNSQKMNYKKYSGGDTELGFYKLCYLLIHSNANKLFQSIGQEPLHIIFDEMSLRDRTRYLKLREILETKGYEINHLGPCISHITAMLQITDLITGALGAVWNTRVIGQCSSEFIHHIVQKSGQTLDLPDAPTEFGRFKINKWLFRTR